MVLDKIKKYIYYYFIKNKIADYQNIDGWLTKSEALCLFHYASLLPANAVLVEIGTWKGKSTYCMAKGLASGIIYSIDPFDASGDKESAIVYSKKKDNNSLLEQFEKTMKKLGVLDKVTPLKGLSNQFVGKFPAIDFLFIDGDHSIEGCDFDFTNYAPYVKKNGYIAFHDYQQNRNELGPVWVINNKIFGSGSYKFQDLYDSIWIAKKL